MPKKRLIYKGKAKDVFEGPEPETYLLHFKDDATAFNKEKHAIINGKGTLNNLISEYLNLKLQEVGIPTHFIRRTSTRDQVVKALEMIPLEVVVRNVVAGSLAKRFGLTEGLALPRSIIEFYYKDDKLGDPLVAEDHIVTFGWAAPAELEEIAALAMRINDFLSGLFMGAGLKLIDIKLEFGRLELEEGIQIMLADEVCPDTCRLWDIKTQRKLDKDVFRRDLGDLKLAYEEVASRLGIVTIRAINQDDKKQ